MSDIPSDLRYTESHEWVSVEEDGTIRVGVTDNAQAQLGDLVYVELPELGATFNAGDACAVVESVKAASDIYAPLAGEVVAVNEDLLDAPEAINNDPYGDGWIFSIKLDEEADPEVLMGAEEYGEVLESA